MNPRPWQDGTVRHDGLRGHDKLGATRLMVLALTLAGPAAAAAANANETAEAVCAPCHGIDGNSTVSIFSRLAGLQAEYIAKQLQDYLSGKRKREVMAPTVSNLAAAEIPGLAAHLAAQKPARDGARRNATRAW